MLRNWKWNSFSHFLPVQGLFHFYCFGFYFLQIKLKWGCKVSSIGSRLPFFGWLCVKGKVLKGEREQGKEEAIDNFKVFSVALSFIWGKMFFFIRVLTFSPFPGWFSSTRSLIKYSRVPCVHKSCWEWTKPTVDGCWKFSIEFSWFSW